ncbi:PHP domain-containing protein [Clostridium sardiniense]|uniref:PHP domain-containing protein n=1 Tax=Clostridium sardiniense TaxID=29369 RepID=UPI00195B1037|nr:PHP domain-containing protein [Clostridium sardiniense]MBM7833629.1 putative metal-dependent phosphoesterase TrpH [Clostridium sardiniense]
MKYADLHIHSTFSDGKLTPEQILEDALKKGIKYISITDHDTIDSQYITKKSNNGVIVIPGIELSSEIDDFEIHILGYFIDVDDIKLNEIVKSLKEARVSRVKLIVKKLKDEGINLDLEDIIKDNSSIGRAHIANEIVRCGYEENFKSAFSKYLLKGKPAYVRGRKLTYKEALKAINDSKGIAVLAHPGKIYRSMAIEKIIKELKCYGLKGIEVYHPSHTKEQINLLYNLSKKYKLLIAGGSDFHDESNREMSIGSEGINEALLNKLINSRCNK